MRFDKLSPGIASMLETYNTVGASAALSQFQMFGVHPAATAQRPSGAPRAVVFLASHPDAKFDDLKAVGIEVNQDSGSLRTAMVPLDQFDKLSEDERVTRIRPTRYLHHAMDAACGKIQLPAFRRNLHLALASWWASSTAASMASMPPSSAASIASGTRRRRVAPA